MGKKYSQIESRLPGKTNRRTEQRKQPVLEFAHFTNNHFRNWSKGCWLLKLSCVFIHKSKSKSPQKHIHVQTEQAKQHLWANSAEKN